MTRLRSIADLPEPLEVRPADDLDRPALERLWTTFRHTMSEFDRALPAPDGTYRSERLERALDPFEQTWSAWTLRAGDLPLGFALTRALDQPRRVLNSFFVVAPVRRHGLGLQFASTVIGASPGPWAVAYQRENRAAATFWPRVAGTFDQSWRCEDRAVPGRPEAPLDTWVTFEAS